MADKKSKVQSKKTKRNTVWYDDTYVQLPEPEVKGQQVPELEDIVAEELLESIDIAPEVETTTPVTAAPFMSAKSKKNMKKTYEDPQVGESKRWDRWGTFSAVSGMSVEELVEKARKRELDLDSRALSRLQKRFFSMPKLVKRQHYACGDQYLISEQLPSLNEMYAEQGAMGGETRGSYELNSKIALWFGDITRLEVDAVVNSCSSSVMDFIVEKDNTGVTKAIVTAASSLLMYDLQNLRRVIFVGDVLVTSGYLLPAKYIFHTSGPARHPIAAEDSLKLCYINCLDKMLDLGIRTLAFPCISTGLKKFPAETAAEFALQTAKEWLQKHSNNVDKIIFCIYEQNNWQIYQDKIRSIFPPCARPISSVESLLPIEILRMDKRSIELYKKALAEGKEAVYNIRVMVMGHFGVGKTTLTKRLFGEDVDLSKRESTNGIQVHIRRSKIDLDTGKWIPVNKDKTKGRVYHRLANLLRQMHLGDREYISVFAEKDLVKSTEKPNLDIVEDHYSEGFDMPDGFIATEESTVKGTEAITLETKERKDSSDETIYTHLKELVNEIQEMQADDTGRPTADLSIWDFAGQYAFYATHQVFLSRRAVYLLVTDISKHTDDVVQDDDCFMDSKGAIHCKISEYVNFWLNSIHEFCCPEDTTGPPVILVGTFVDKLQEDSRKENIDDFFYNLRCSLVDKVTSLHLVDEDFAVDNTKVDETLDSLKSKILQTSSEQDFWGELIPAKWITLENILLNLKTEGLKVLEKTRVMEVNSTLPVPIEEEDEMELFLSFHHESGNIIYFSKDDKLSQTIVLDPQWLVDAFKCLITAKMFCCRQPDILKQWIEFDNSAILSLKLIDAVWRRESSFKDHIKLLVEYLEKLGLLAKPFQWEVEQQEQMVDCYFAPSVLKEKPPVTALKCTNDNVKSTSKLCLTTPSQFLPTAVFNKLLAACLKKFPLSKHKDKRMIYCGCGVFDLENNHRVCVYLYDNVIHVWLTRYSAGRYDPDLDTCLKARDFILGFLEKQLKNVTSYIQCPNADICTNCHMFATDDLFHQEEILCSCQEAPHLLKTEEVTKYWFGKESVSVCIKPTDRDLNRIARHIGKEYTSLGLELGLSQAEIDHVNIEHRTVVDRTTSMLIRWRDNKATQATFEELRTAMFNVGADYRAAFASLQRTDVV